MIRMLILSLVALVFFADPVAADPISGLIAAGKAFFATKIGAIIAQVAISAGLSLLAQRLRKKPKQPGLQNQFKGRGGTEPGSFVLGRAAVKGHQTYHNSRGDNFKFYHEVIELCDLPGATLERLIIDGAYSEIGNAYLDDNFEASDPAADIGNIIVSKNKDSDSHRAWIKYYDGTQASADAMLAAFFANDDRRWTTDHKLQGIAYAVLTYYFDRKRFPRGVPELSFEMLGIPVYDPRRDSSVGGSGAHRWNEPETWEQSENLIVLVYNILRGIAAPGGAVWGGDCEHEDLPMANWVAGMNACDVDVDGRKKYTGGIEVRWTDAPADIIDQLLAGCNAQITELGGVYRVQVDAPATAVVSVTDEDFIVSDPSEMDPFPGLEGTFNGGTVVHPDPAQLWNASQPHTVTNPALETQDGTQRLFDLQLPVVHNEAQAKQVLNAAINDGRRFRRHKGMLPPDLFWLDTLSTFAWTSEAEGYDAKLFEISETAYDLLTFNTMRSIRERDPSDFPVVPGLELPSTPGVTVPIIRVDAGVTGFAFEPVIITVEDGPQRPAFRLSWDAAALDGNIAGIAYELRVLGGDMNAKSGSTTDIAAGSLILSGDIIPDSLYEARTKALSNTRDTNWGNWAQALAPNVGIGVGGVIGVAGEQGFGVGVYPGRLPVGFSNLAGNTDPASENYGNYVYSDGSVMVFVPRFYYRIGSSSSPHYATYGFNAIDIAGVDTFADEGAANAAGYALHRAFIDGGAVKRGFFIDKYLCSRNASKDAGRSVQNGVPIELFTDSEFLGSADMTGCSGILADGVILSRARGAGMNAASVFMHSALWILSLAHGQAATSVVTCAWYDASDTTNFPKGCNNRALGDVDDNTLSFISAGIPGVESLPLTGSSNNLAKTAHNGQSCGVIDLNGVVFEMQLGLTAPGASATEVAAIGSGDAYVLKKSTALGDLTAGYGGATDAWGSSEHLWTLYDYEEALFVWGAGLAFVSLGNGTNQVLDGAVSGVGYQRTASGLPMDTDSYSYGDTGTNLYGSDGLLLYNVANLCPLAGGSYSDRTSSGIGRRGWSTARSDSLRGTGFRASFYGS